MIALDVPTFARWNSKHNQTDSLLTAGASLACLHGFWLSPLRYRGALAECLALKAAAASLRSSGRPEDEDAVRDQWWFRQAGDVLSPAAATFRGWLKLTEFRQGWEGVTPARLEEVAGLFGHRLDHPPDQILAAINQAIEAIANPLRAAVESAKCSFSLEANEALAHLTADAVLAARLGWEKPLPLLAAHVALPELRAGGSRRRALPSDPGWEGLTFAAYTLAVPSVLSVARRFHQSAEVLSRMAPKLRAKAKAAVLDAVLAHACLSGATPIAGISDRGMRRLLERLAAAGALKELTGRPTFRLYGLGA